MTDVCGLCLKHGRPVCAECYLSEVDDLRSDVALLSKKLEEMQVLLNRFGIQRLVTPS